MMIESGFHPAGYGDAKQTASEIFFSAKPLHGYLRGHRVPIAEVPALAISEALFGATSIAGYCS